MIHPRLSEEIQRLQAQAEQKQRTASRASVHPRDRFEPMHVRLDRQLAKIPEGVKRDGMAMDYLTTLVQGQRGRGSTKQVSDALRKLGWFRLRCWSHSASESGGFRALWYPPVVASTAVDHEA